MRRLLRAIRNEQSILFALAAAIGVAVGYGVIGFRHLIGLFQLLFYSSDSEEYFATVVEVLPAWHVLLAPAIGGLMIGLFVHYLMPDRRNHGVADIIEACALRGGRMNGRAGVGAALAAAASIGAGASVGREGPAVHLGASVSAWIAERLRLSRNLSLTLIGCGAAAAVAASFNAPIAGVFFALEVVVGHYALNVFAPIVISSVIATMVTQLYLGDTPAFLFVPEYFVVSFLEVPAFVLLGLVCAGIAAAFMHSTMFAQDTFARLPIPPWLRPAVGGFAVGAIALLYPQVLGVGYQATDLALKEAFTLTMLIGLVVAKTAATAIALGSGFAGGVFSPSLFLGAMTGGAFGIIAGSAFPEYASTHGAYTIIGMGGVAAAVLGAPISTILIVFELTSNYQLTIAVMIVAVLASMVSQRLARRSFFVWQLERRGIHLRTAQETAMLLAITVDDLISEDYAVISTSATLKQVCQLLAQKRPAALLVVDEQERLCGYLASADVVKATLDQRGEITAGDIARPSKNVILPHASLERALKLIAAQDEEYLPVVDDTGKSRVVGVVYHRDLIRAHNRALLAARAEERGDT
ncbi:MAG: chloride channel protein [Acidiferrobacterales bacterium]